MDLSIVVVSYNTRDLLLGCLRSIEDTRADLECEVFVVDNASSDGSAAAVREHFPAVHLMANADNRGFAAANNQALPVARGRHVLLLNPDTVLRSGTLAAMVAFLDDTTDAGIVGCRILDSAGRPRLSCYPLPSVATVLWQHWQLYKLFPPCLYSRHRDLCVGSKRSSAVSVGWVTGACFMIRRRALDEVGLLDERYFLFVEEVDFCRRAAAAGWRTYFLPSAQVVHLESQSTRRVVPVKLRSHYLSKLRYFAKFERPSALLAVRLVFLADLSTKAMIRAAGLPLRRPPDAASRLAVYCSLARECLFYSGTQSNAR